jgi:hypothetical protein
MALKNLFTDKVKLYKWLVLIAIGFLYMARSLNDFSRPFAEGDAQEYILTTEAICNHFTPDIRATDVISFKEKFSKAYGWENYYNRETQDAQIINFQKGGHWLLENAGGIYYSKGNKWYSQHFWFYSYLNAPLYKLFSHKSPLRPFYVMNALMVIIMCYLLLFKTPFRPGVSILAALCFGFSAVYWYLGWEHTEILTMCLVGAGLVSFFNSRSFLSLLLIAVASLQNQPLLALFGFLALIVLKEKGFTLKNMIRVGCIGLICLLPPFFYYINFEVTNIVKAAGFLDTQYITFNRVSGFYFDFNQGMILTIPLILLCYIFFLLREYYEVIRTRRISDYSIFIPFAIIIMSVSVSTMGNWNHGMAVINRYATWMSIIVMIQTFYLIHKYLSELKTLVLFNYLFCTQCFTTLYHQQFNEFDWGSAFNTPLAKWAYQYHPKLYNPDPVIFAGRLRTELQESNSPIIYFKSRAPKKIMVHKNRIDDLRDFGVSRENIERIKKSISYNYGWGYVDMSKFKSQMSNEEIYMMKRKRRVDAVIAKIKTSNVWMDQIREKAKIWGKTFEEGMLIDAEYIVSEEERKNVDD